MEDSFSEWRDSSREDKSFVISDSDEDVNESNEKEQVFVIESSESSENSESSANVSANISISKRASLSEKLPLTEKLIKDRIKKNIPCYSDSEDANDHNDPLSANSSEDSVDDDNDNASSSEVEQTTKSNDKVWRLYDDSNDTSIDDIEQVREKSDKVRRLEHNDSNDTSSDEVEQVLKNNDEVLNDKRLEHNDSNDTSSDEVEQVMENNDKVLKDRQLEHNDSNDTSSDEVEQVLKNNDEVLNDKRLEHNDSNDTSSDEVEQVMENNDKVLKDRQLEHNDSNDTSSDEVEQVMENNDKVLNDRPLEDVSRENKNSFEIDVSNVSEGKEHILQSKIAVSLAEQETGFANIDPFVAQKRALLVCKLEQLENQLSKTKILFTVGNISSLPDKGEKLRNNIAMQEKEIEEIKMELEKTPLSEAQPDSIKPEVSDIDEPTTYSDYYNLDNIPFRQNSSSKELGKKAQATLEKELALTADRLQDLHGSLVARPTEEERAEDPQGLKVKLMPHQQHALAWLIWREQQKPPGGILADDMGLGKTLTMISLIIASIAKKKLGVEDSDSEEWLDSSGSKRYHKGGTLVVCPASLLSQWENEINHRCKRGMLSVTVYHGANRMNVPKKLAKYDIVITTYNLLTREFKSNSTAYEIHWERVILDEAHIIRNHKSQASQSVCGLVARKRWALTGTPIQNKEMDLYSILKFLKCSPFDDIRVWRRWVDNKSAAGRQRLATVMKTLMLRRTKQELQAKGALESLPEKFVEEISVKLDPDEQLVYEKILIYSRSLFAQFLAQRAEKDHMFDLAAGKYDKPTFLSNPNKNTQFTKAQNKLLSLHADVKAHEILVLLLRLRQICVHPSLIRSMLDEEDIKESGITESENLDSDLLLQINKITLEDGENDEGDTNETEIGVDRRVATNLLTSKNPVFKSDRISSKVKLVLDKVTEILQKNDKMIIVSQWTSTLNIIASCLSSIKGASFNMFTGNVPIKERQGVMDSFNVPNRDPKILLLSLTAGGVGLNLIGGNHLLLIDIHWNPQLEVQAQDRIYRFGQRKDVFIYKFICKDTIEDRIRCLQEKKMEIAQHVLSGDKNSAVSKLTLDDLKSLFGL
ncbi:transcription termination factor 2-like isoform X2 [Frieseomelitta varia]|uniref:transcription termination factor 2-like isoform X2 n=1 Tax=Frieseomelitta varia TaxID=561572 RepID=UPI001CB6AB7F|nr:transcription termination factor 2-like isoform X2 [Frieseomelitta varia]